MIRLLANGHAELTLDCLKGACRYRQRSTQRAGCYRARRADGTTLSLGEGKVQCSRPAVTWLL